MKYSLIRNLIIVKATFKTWIRIRLPIKTGSVLPKNSDPKHCQEGWIILKQMLDQMCDYVCKNTAKYAEYRKTIFLDLYNYVSLDSWRCGGSLVAHQDFWGTGPGFESDISHNNPDALQDHCVIM